MTRSKMLAGLVAIMAAGAALWWAFRRPAAGPSAPRYVERQTPVRQELFQEKPGRMKIVSAVWAGAGGGPMTPPRNGWPLIQVIIDSRRGYLDRMDAIDRLPGKLTEADWQVLRAFLVRKAAIDQGQLGQILKNELMDKLCAMSPGPSTLCAALADIYRDLNQNEVVRDYAVQHLAALDSILQGSSGAEAGRQEEMAEKTLWQALNEIGDSIAGTALLGLKHLSDQGVAIDRDQLSQAALGLANNSAAAEMTRVTAYEVCGELNVQAALPLIESAAANSSSDTLRISAAGALGSLGGAGDLTILQRMMDGTDGRLKLPAQMAMGRIQRRLQTQTSAQ